MAIVRKFGRPDLFVTFTCNPELLEITAELLERQTSKDCPDLVSRVFQLKLIKMIKDINDEILGDVSAKIWVIEFQKRGLPRCHLLIILSANHKMTFVEE